ncbi:MAG: dihydrolipoyl dehydrogenase [Candidatus Cloacimonetes bacterium 4572_65]|nr:MAG: dihydrolipoyl dehydrogenase [Candidatus Cloacimonetes bacterium 4572_65]
MRHFKVAIIGGGPGGYVTALRLKQYNIEAVVFEKERLGGVCLNWGCIPTKTLVKSSELYSEILEAKEFGIKLENPEIDFEQVYKRKDGVVEKLVSGIEFMFKKKKMPVINDTVHTVSKDGEIFTVVSETESITADYVILATGSAPSELPFMKFDHEKILSSKDILSLKKQPKTLAVVGGGVIGCEFASIFQQIGTKVTIVEFLPRLLAGEDEEISKRIAMSFKRQKMKLIVGKGVESFEHIEGGIKLNVAGGKSVEAEQVLVSIGRTPRCEINFEGFDVTRDRGSVQVDEFMRTGVENLFAIGDLTGKQLLAHTASKQGLVVAEIIKSEVEEIPKNLEPIVYENIPRCTFTNPEVASVGLTETEAKEKYEEILVGKFPYSASGKAMGMGNTFGFVKTIANKQTGKIIGMHIIGLQASELIAQGAILIGKNADVHDVEKIVFAHPTLSEIIMESIEDTISLAVHKI